MPRIDDTTALSTWAATDATASSLVGGQAYLAEVARRLAPSDACSQSRHRVMAYWRGLRSEAARTNSWPVAAVCGESIPDGFQDVLSRADGDAAAVRDARRRDVIPPLGDANGVLVLDATGLLKHGAHAAGVARPSRGTAGTVEHGPSGVCLSSARALGHAVRERER